MSTSDWSPLESQDIKLLRALAGASFEGPLTLPSGRVLPADEATALAGVYAPAASSLPVVDGDGVNRSFCCHGEVSCARCALAEVRHQAAIEPHWEREEAFWRHRIGVALLFLFLACMILICGWLFISHAPTLR